MSAALRQIRAALHRFLRLRAGLPGKILEITRREKNVRPRGKGYPFPLAAPRLSPGIRLFPCGYRGGRLPGSVEFFRKEVARAGPSLPESALPSARASSPSERLLKKAQRQPPRAVFSGVLPRCRLARRACFPARQPKKAVPSLFTLVLSCIFFFGSL